MNLGEFIFFYPETAQLQPRIAISACLQGDKVRYDGDSKTLTGIDFFHQHFQLLPVCPEVGAGLPVPRPPVQLVQTENSLRALGRDDPAIDVTEALLDYRQQSFAELSRQAISGYIFKSRSPSCGLNSTPLFDKQGQAIATGSGIQADYFQQHMPWLVLREETQLSDSKEREVFLWLCRASSDCQQAIERQQVSAFHQHYQNYFPKLGTARDIVSTEYRRRLLTALAAAIAIQP